MEFVWVFLMAYLMAFLILTFVSWVTLLILIPIAQRLAHFAMPPIGQLLWRLAVVAAATNGLALAGSFGIPFLGWLVGIIVFFLFMVKWFRIGILCAVTIVVVSWGVRCVVEFYILLPILFAMVVGV